MVGRLPGRGTGHRRQQRHRRLDGDLDFHQRPNRDPDLERRPSSSAATVTARNMGYNGNLAAGASTTFGFIGSWNGTNSVPTLSCTPT